MSRLFFLVAFLPFASLAFEVVSPQPGETVRILNESQRAYLAMSLDERVEYLETESNRKPMTKAGWLPVPTVLSWRKVDGATNYNLRVGCVETDRTLRDENLAGTEAKIDNLEIAREYRWEVRADRADGSALFATGWFLTEDLAPRTVRMDGVPNMRDIGGRVGLDGRRVRQGLVYRSAGLNDNACKMYSKDEIMAMYRDGTLLTAVPQASLAKATEIKRGLDAGKKESKIDFTHLPKVWAPGRERLDADRRRRAAAEFGIKTDIDLRSDRECYLMTGSPLGYGVNWVHISSAAYDGMSSESGRAAFARVFRIFLDERNYPIDFHCIAGADRTGAVAFILNALLGVGEDELYKDWEFTAFHNWNPKFNHGDRFWKLVKVFDAYPGKTINERVLGYVRSLGFAAEDIEKFREIMLEPKN